MDEVATTIGEAGFRRRFKFVSKEQLSFLNYVAAKSLSSV
jgi:hypothetical protein